MNTSKESIAYRWDSIVQRAANAALKSGRKPEDVKIIGVTKYVDASQARALYEAGCHDFGESRPQALWEKADALKELGIRWHLIGHLQRNKSRRTLPMVHCIHSVDSLRLAEQLEADARELELTIPVLLEVNVTSDSSKTGLTPRELPLVASKVIELPHLRCRGLMGMAGLDNPEPRLDFAAIRNLRDALQTTLGTAAQLDQLSMGMSGDFEAAIQEGSTMIRVGSILFPS